MSSENNRDTKIPASKQELFYYDEENELYKPLVSDGYVPVYVVEGNELENMRIQSVGEGVSVGRETKMYTPKQELFYFDTVNGVYKPLASNGAIPVYIVNQEIETDIDCGTFSEIEEE